MPRYRLEVSREIPCAPFWAPVTAEEIAYLNLTPIHGLGFEGSADDLETVLMAAGERIPAGRTLDRTFIVALDTATGERADVNINCATED